MPARMAGDLDNASYFAYFELAGIWQPIEVFATSPTYISHLAVTTDFDKDYRDANLSVELDAVNQQAEESRSVDQLAAARSRKATRWLPCDAVRLSVSLGPWERKTLQLQDDGQIAAAVERRAAAAL